MTEGSPGRTTGPTDDVTIISIANVILRRIWTIAIVAIVSGAVSVLIGIKFGNYVAQSAFRPTTSSTLSGLASIAAQLGADVGGLAASETEPLEFWAQMLRSRDLLDSLARSSLRFNTDVEDGTTMEGNIIELYAIERASPQETHQAAVDRLRGDISVGTDLTSGVVTLKVTAPWPELAEVLNRTLLVEVNELNLRTRQTQASAEAVFVEGRLGEAHAALVAAEDSLEMFLELNRSYQTSPRLVFEEARLQRRVDLRQQVYVTLAQALEQARIARVRNTPVIAVLESPEGSARPSMGLAGRLILGLFLGSVFGLVLVLAQDAINRRRHESPEMAEFLRLIGSLVPRFRRRPTSQKT